MSVIYKKLETTRRMVKRVSAERVGSNGVTASYFTEVADGSERIIYAVEMDFAMLADLACKAASNKSRKSRVGPLTIEVIKRERIQ